MSARRAQRAWRWVVRRPARGVALSGIASLLASAAITCVYLPAPRMHDEFSYLLAADTFRHGRLANPTHPMWVHFETFHVLQKPTYASKYPPLQGLFLALGTVVGGHPIVGAWIATALAAAACCWMLQGWLPRRWAALGGLLVALHWGFAFYWSQSYWGGSVGLLGGALLFGALPRLLRAPRAANALALATGVAVLANSRPYEGFVASVLVACVLAVHYAGPARPPLAVSVRRVVLPAGALLALTAAAMAYYDYRVTGDAFRLPYQVYEATYSVNPLFLWQDPPPAPAYRHAVFAQYYLGWVLDQVREQQHLGEVLRRKGVLLWFYLAPALALPLLVLPAVERSRRMALAAALLLAGFAAILAIPGSHPRYLAPVVPLLFLLVLRGLRQMRLFVWRGRRVGRALVTAVVAAQVGFFGVAYWYHATRIPKERVWADARARIQSALERTPGRHLVLVRYGPGHSPHEEWVYNEADIDAARVVWARDMGSEGNRDLLAYFEDRRTWILLADANPPQLAEVGRATARRD